ARKVTLRGVRKRQACWHAGQSRLGMNHTILDTKYRTSVRLARSSDDQPAPCRGIGVGTSSQSLEVMHRTRRRLGHTSLFCQSLVLRIWNRPVIWNDLCYAYTA